MAEYNIEMTGANAKSALQAGLALSNLGTGIVKHNSTFSVGAITDSDISGTISIAHGGTGNTVNQAESVTYTTAAPTSANTNGVKIAILTSEPSTKYDG